MQVLNLPKYTFRIKEKAQKIYIFDVFRKKWVRLTPEEWVRQNFISYLVKDCHFPKSRIGVEVSLSVNGRSLRADGVVYDDFGSVRLLLEFKAPTVTITEETFAQTADYNTKVGAKYIIISNGLSHYCALVNGSKITLLENIPLYSQL